MIILLREFIPFFCYGMLLINNWLRIYVISNIKTQIHVIKIIFKFYLMLNFLLNLLSLVLYIYKNKVT